MKLWPLSNGQRSINELPDGVVLTQKGSNFTLHSFYEIRYVADLPDKKYKNYVDQVKPDGSSVFEGLQRTNTPFSYFLLARPLEGEFFEYESYLGTWVSCNKGSMSDARTALEQQMKVIAAALAVGLPGCSFKRIEGSRAAHLVDRLLSASPGLKRRMVPAAMGLLAPVEFSRRGGESPTPEFYVPTSVENLVEGVPVARIIVNGQVRQHLYMDREDIARHICILGMTGSGKTTTAMTIARGLAERGIPFTVLDTHNEYAEMARSLGGVIVAPGRDEFILNPLENLGTSSISEHAALVTDIFGEIYRFTSPQSFLFRNSILKLLSDGHSGSEHRQDLSGLTEIIEGSAIKSAYDNETKLALLRRLLPLTEGQGGRALCGVGTVNMSELLSKPTVIELGHFRDFETRTLFASFFLKAVHDYRVGSSKSSLQHAMIIEEARYLVPSRRPEDPPHVTERLSSELRKFGEAVVYVAQFPSQISAEAIKNTGVRIAHRIAWTSDLNVLADAMNLNQDQAKYLNQLSVGQAIINIARLRSSVLASIIASDSREDLRQVLQ